jgi:hypothetical protein
MCFYATTGELSHESDVPSQHGSGLFPLRLLDEGEAY